MSGLIERGWREGDYSHLEGHTYRINPVYLGGGTISTIEELGIGAFDLHYQVNRDLIVVSTLKEVNMAVRTDLPDPTKGQAEWIAQMVRLDGLINMRDYRDYSGKDKRLWMVEGARRVSAALHAKMLEVELTPIGDDRVNCYRASDDCKSFWKNGKEQSMTDEEILNGWMAMMSMQEDLAPKD